MSWCIGNAAITTASFPELANPPIKQRSLIDYIVYIAAGEMHRQVIKSLCYTPPFPLTNVR